MLRKIKRRTFLIYSSLSLVTFSMASIVYFETKEFTITNLKINLGLKKRIVQISDTHVDTSIYDMNLLVDLVKKLNPDLIVHTGDLLTRISGVHEVLNLLEKLSKITETFVVFGNHDIWSGLNRNEIFLKKLMKMENVYLLVNASLHHDGFWICGVNDPYTSNDNLKKTLENVDDSKKILLSHSPQIIKSATGKVDLVLSGHTHGGQVVLPIIGAIWIPLPYEFWKYRYGLFKERDTYMFVSRGIGTSFVPIRFNCPPEIVCIDV